LIENLLWSSKWAYSTPQVFSQDLVKSSSV
jgi:hypothetical protein